MSASEIVTKLRAMAADPNHRVQLVKESETIPSLILFLKSEDKNIAFTALETVYFLSLSNENRVMMAQELELLKLLKAYMMMGSLKEKKVSIASYTNLQAHAASLPSGCIQNENSSNTASPGGQNKILSTVKQIQTVTNTYTVFVSDLSTPNYKEQFSKEALKLSGVVSVYCDLVESKAVIRAIIPLEEVLEYLKGKGYAVSTRKKDVISKSLDDGYLEEMPQAAANTTKSWLGFSGMVTYGTETPEQRKARLESQNSSGWFGKIGKALRIL